MQSPLSISSNDSSFVGRYGALGSGPGGASTPTSSEIPYTGGPYGAARPLQASPPSSQHPSGSTDMSRPSASGSSVNGNRPPSSASSLGMSNDGRMPFPKPGSRERDGPRGPAAGEEAALQRHYTALKSYLAVHLQDEKGNIRPNRARDKLLRLSSTQFMELSTDVYDELIRREDERTRRVENGPRFLLPKQSFHPKRNQARQKLSTLPTDRFRQLATDVFYELERRIPRFAGGDISRPRSTTSNASARSRATSRAGGRPPPGPGFGYPPGPGGRGRGYPAPGMGGPPRPYSPGPNGIPPRRPSEGGSMRGSLGRPLPKHLQSNTIVPNKGTMVEDDDEEDDEDAFGLDHVSVGLGGQGEDKERLQAQESEITELKEKLESLENQLADKDQQISKGASEEERSEWTSLREELEQKHLDVQRRNESLEQQHADVQRKNESLEQKHQDAQRRNESLEQDLAAQKEKTLQMQQDSAPPEEYAERIRELEDELAKQEQISREVREEATIYIQEMRDLSRQNDEAIAQEEKLAARVSQLEKENNEWRQRYARVKAQNKHLRASTMGLGLQTGFDSGSLVRQEGLISEGGLVRDTDVTRFQVAVDELLKVARQSSTDAMLESVKSVVISVQSITAGVGTDGYPTPSPSPMAAHTNMQQAPSVSKIKARVMGTANSLITATKQHAASHGLSPVALLDAAASNLTAAVVELIKAVHIRPSNKSETADLDAADELSSFYNDGLSPLGGNEDEGPLTLRVPEFNQPQPPPPPPPEKDSTTELTRKKSNGGWFGWGKKWNGKDEDEQDHHEGGGPPATPNGLDHHGVAGNNNDESDSEYDPYR